MSFNWAYALEFAGFWLLGMACERIRRRAWAWWVLRRGGHLAPVTATDFWASMFLLVVLISIAFQASSRIKQDQDNERFQAAQKRQAACFSAVIAYNFGLLNDRGKLSSAVSTAQKAFYRDLENALVHPIGPRDAKARAAQLKNFTDDTKAVVAAQNAIDDARDNRPYHTGKKCA